MRLEVRCCCVPKKLLGWVDVEDRRVFNGARLKFRVARQVRIADLRAGDGPVYDVIREEQTISLPVARITTGSPAAFAYGVTDEHLAIKSEETPIEILRRIPGFVENTEADL